MLLEEAGAALLAVGHALFLRHACLFIHALLLVVHQDFAVASEHLAGALLVGAERHLVVDVHLARHRLHVDVGADEIEGPSHFLEAVDEPHHLIHGVVGGGILHAVGDDGDDAGGVLVCCCHGLELGERGAYGVEERSAAAGLIVVMGDVAGVGHRDVLAEIAGGGASRLEGIDRYEHVLCVGVSGLEQLCHIDCLVAAGDGGVDAAAHGARLVEDDEVEYGGLGR